MPVHAQDHRLCAWHECTGCDSPLRAGDPVAARQWALRWVDDAAALAALRAVAGRLPATLALVGTDDQPLIDALGTALANGELRVCGNTQPRQLFRLVPAAAPPAPAAPPPPAPAPRPAVAPALPPVVETTLGADLDVAAMVQVLREAARDGVPFCEECARAAAEAAEASGA